MRTITCLERLERRQVGEKTRTEVRQERAWPSRQRGPGLTVGAHEATENMTGGGG